MRRLVSLALGLAASIAGGAIGWALVRRDIRVWESGGFTAGPEMILVVFLAVVCGVVTTFLAWRALVGPPLERAEWTLIFSVGTDEQSRLGDLLGQLGRLGYALDALRLDEATAPLGPAAVDQPLAGASLRLVERSLGAHRGRLVLRVPPPRDEGGESLGFLDVHGAVDGPYDELARYVVAALGELMPGLSFKRMDSALDPEPASSVRDELPERPLHLARRD